MCPASCEDNLTIENLLILWDIDGTLISLPKKSSNRHIEAVEIYTKNKLIPLSPKLGSTDRGILKEIFELNQIELSEDALSSCLKILNINSKKEITSSIHKLTPGIINALNLVNRQGSINSILTGNSMERATHKLQINSMTTQFNLDFSFYGDNYLDRESLVFAAKQKILHQSDFTDLILVGDTPLDVISAKKNGLKVIAVTTGMHTAEELSRFNPDLIIKDFKADLSVFFDFLQD